MAEKKDVAMNTFTPATDAAYIYAEVADGTQVKIKKSDLFKTIPYPYTGCGIIISNLENGKWYRIAIGSWGSDSSSVIINTCKMYGSGAPSSRLFYVSADGYSGNQSISILGKGGTALNISKARIVYQASSAIKVMLDIYVSSSNINLYKISYSNNVNFVFQEPEEVSESIPEGYSVREFIL